MPDINEIKKIVVPIAYSYGVKRLYLFGSYAKGTASEKSDLVTTAGIADDFRKEIAGTEILLYEE